MLVKIETYDHIILFKAILKYMHEGNASKNVTSNLIIEVEKDDKLE